MAVMQAVSRLRRPWAIISTIGGRYDEAIGELQFALARAGRTDRPAGGFRM